MPDENPSGNVLAITLKITASDKAMLDDAIRNARLSRSEYIRGILRYTLTEGITQTPDLQISKIEQELIKLRNMIKTAQKQ